MPNTYIVDIIVDLQNDFVDGALGTAEAQGIVGPRGEPRRPRPRGTGTRCSSRSTPTAPTISPRGKGATCPCRTASAARRATRWPRRWPRWPKPATLPARTNSWSKRTPSARGDLPGAVAAFLAAQGPGAAVEKFRVYGVCTDICVISNALLLRAFYPETPIEILAACCAGVTPESHATALKAMAACQCRIVE